MKWIERFSGPTGGGNSGPRRLGHHCLQSLSLSFVLLITTVSGLRAQVTAGNVSTGDWSNPANWTASVPNAGLSAIIGYGSSGTATISSSDTNQAALDVLIGQSNSGALVINGGSLRVGANGIVVDNGDTGAL